MKPLILSAPASNVGNGRCIHPPSQRRSGHGAYPGVVQPDTGFDGDVPSFREHTRIPVADTQTAGMTFIAFRSASEVVTDIGKVLSEKVSHEGFVEPVAAAELYGVEVHREGCGIHRIPIAGQLQRPVVRQGRFGPRRSASRCMPQGHWPSRRRSAPKPCGAAPTRPPTAAGTV